LFAVIGGSIHFALQKHKLPKAGLLQIGFIRFHFVFSFQLNSAIDKGLSGVDQGNADAISQLASFWKFLELAVKWITLKDLRLKDSPTSPESQVKTLHRPYICHPRS
jgi:hypothetical protein